MGAGNRMFGGSLLLELSESENTWISLNGPKGHPWSAGMSEPASFPPLYILNGRVDRGGQFRGWQATSTESLECHQQWPMLNLGLAAGTWGTSHLVAGGLYRTQRGQKLALREIDTFQISVCLSCLAHFSKTPSVGFLNASSIVTVSQYPVHGTFWAGGEDERDKTVS